MSTLRSFHFLGALAGLVALFAARGAEAHFLWVNAGGEGSQRSALLYFSESAAEQNYRLPERVMKSTFQARTPSGETRSLEAELVETDARICLQAPLDDQNVILEATCEYGIYHGSLLTYYAKHVASVTPDASSVGRSPKLTLDILPEVVGKKLQLTVLWQGKPLPGAEVVIDARAGELIEAISDEAGRVTFEPTTAGLIGIRAGHQEEDATGEWDGASYDGAAHYATLTLNWQPPAPDDRTARNSYPDLPEPIASFGAAVHGGWLYVYGGHTGRSHAHSRENISQRFQRLNLRDGQSWEELPMQTHVQSPALVAHGDYLYRIGGMTALNAPDEEDDLHSVDDFARFDPQARAWKEMPSLPQPRSSHDAVVIGDTLYVIGGWILDGVGHGEWCPSALAFDLTAEEGQWRELPEPAFRRRALAAADWQGKLVAIGGMTDESEVSQRVDFFDPATQAWTRGPDLPTSDMHGFGIAASTVNGSLYVSGATGIVYRLNGAEDRWEEVAELDLPRFFHRLVEAPGGDLLAIAGAARGHGHIAGIERVSLGGRAPSPAGANGARRAGHPEK